MASAPDLLRRHLLLDGTWLACCTALAGPVRAEPDAAVAPRLLLAGTARADIDPHGYLVSEKYDGVRAFWDGRSLRFRSGRPIAAPESFIRRLPAQPLDGELWLGRRRFDELSGIARAQRPDEHAWRDVRYLVFELPEAPGSFAQRAARIEELARRIGWPSFQSVDQALIADRAGLQRRFDAVVAAGGEGLMLHRADAPYLSGRGDVLLKLKPAFDDEAVVIAHLTGRGRHARQLGALEVRTDDGRRFRLGTGFSDAERADPPPLGSRVTFRYRERTPAGTPRFASFVRRHDEF